MKTGGATPWYETSELDAGFRTEVFERDLIFTSGT